MCTKTCSMHKPRIVPSRLLLAAVKVAGLVPTYIPCDKHTWLPDFSKVSAEAAGRCTCLLLNYPNNPTGVVVGPGFWQEVLQFCEQHDLLLIHDNPYQSQVREATAMVSVAAWLPWCVAGRWCNTHHSQQHNECMCCQSAHRPDWRPLHRHQHTLHTPTPCIADARDLYMPQVSLSSGWSNDSLQCRRAKQAGVVHAGCRCLRSRALPAPRWHCQGLLSAAWSSSVLPRATKWAASGWALHSATHRPWRRLRL